MPSPKHQKLPDEPLKRARPVLKPSSRGKPDPGEKAGFGSYIAQYITILKNAGRLCIDRACAWCVVFKLRLLLVLLLVLPLLAILIGLESRPRDMRNYVAIGLLASVMLLAPLSRLIGHFLILRDLKAVEEFCLRLKGGDYNVQFKLPPQQDEEHEMLILKRNLNWMAHVISRREHELQRKLEETDADRNRYESMSMLDPLTGLFNRRGMELKLTQMTREASVAGRPLSMMFLDADKFKEINDTFGHEAGDELLRNLGRILQKNVRQGVDVPFRFGGDEFGVLFVGFGIDQTSLIGRRILRAYNESRIGSTTLSIGIAAFSSTEGGPPEADARQLLKSADMAAYKAKQQGGNRIYVFRPEIMDCERRLGD